MKKLIRFIFCLIIILNIRCINALSEDDYLYHNSSYEYVIDSYDINIVVNENNTFDITETITAYFNTPKHGIFRTIPLKNTVNRLDGTTSKNRAKITDLSVDNEFTTSRENGNLKVKIGSASRTLTGEVTYVIKYNYNIGRDPLKNVDELYYNLIGPDWDTVIRNVSFKIVMPKEFDSSKLGFSSGIFGSTENSNVKYQIDGNTISGYYDGILNKNEALTVRLELPDGYFEGNISIVKLLYCIPILGLLFLIYVWMKHWRDDSAVETVEFYPPDDLNSLDIGFIYKGKATNKDVISLLIYLANKGYFKITEFNDKSLFSRHNSFKLTKLKDYDGKNYNEWTFLDGLFFLVDEVSSSYWESNYYRTVNLLMARVNKDENKSKIIDIHSLNKITWIIVISTIIFAVISILPVLATDDLGLIFSVLFPIVGFVILSSSLFGRNFLKNRVFGTIFGLLFGGLPWCFITLPAILQSHEFIVIYVIGMILIIGMLIICKNLPKRTKYGTEMLGKIKGFKRFLETVEKEKLESIVSEHPTYFYDILPYTYVLGISNKWIKKFESIKFPSPSWYAGSNDFTFDAFGSFISSTLSSSERSLRHVQSKEYGGSSSSFDSSSSDFSSYNSSSGGGSSGGGSGGGGGGSW